MSTLRATLAVLAVVVGAGLVSASATGAASDPSGSTRWTITDLGTFGPAWTSGSAAAVNGRGEIAGSNGTSTGKQHAFIWRRGHMLDLGTLGGRGSGASGINERGEVIGTSLTARPARLHAFVWHDGTMTDLGTLGGRSSRPRAINDSGEVVGESYTASGAVHAFLWRDGTMTDLGTLGGADSYATGINEHGQVVGTSSTANGRQHAFLWQDGRMTDLGTLGARYTSSTATAVDDRGAIVGTSYLATVTQIGQLGHAFVWRSGKMSDLGTLGLGYPASDAVGLNARGEVIGSSRALTGPPRPVLWRNGRVVALYAGRAYGAAVAIDDRGRVIGARVPARGSVVHAFVWQSGRLTDLGTLGGAESDAAAISGSRIVGVASTKRGARHPVLWSAHA